MGLKLYWGYLGGYRKLLTLAHIFNTLGMIYGFLYNRFWSPPDVGENYGNIVFVPFVLMVPVIIILDIVLLDLYLRQKWKYFEQALLLVKIISYIPLSFTVLYGIFFSIGMLTSLM